ncbi:hypothetical protein CNR22_13075 [Sphingobacteriaceae bacterium]|nr:hypothetical protein CNR22_13075 [Sphingobacteriaceae bacterium]
MRSNALYGPKFSLSEVIVFFDKVESGLGEFSWCRQITGSPGECAARFRVQQPSNCFQLQNKIELSCSFAGICLWFQMGSACIATTKSKLGNFNMDFFETERK